MEERDENEIRLMRIGHDLGAGHYTKFEDYFPGCDVAGCKHRAMKNDQFCSLHWGEIERSRDDWDAGR